MSSSTTAKASMTVVGSGVLLPGPSRFRRKPAVSHQGLLLPGAAAAGVWCSRRPTLSYRSSRPPRSPTLGGGDGDDGVGERRRHGSCRETGGRVRKYPSFDWRRIFACFQHGAFVLYVTYLSSARAPPAAMSNPSVSAALLTTRCAHVARRWPAWERLDLLRHGDPQTCS